MKLDLPAKALERYLIDNIDFNLDEENLEGLKLYYEKAASAGLIPRNRPLEFASVPAQSTRSSRSVTPWSASANSAGCAGIL